MSWYNQDYQGRGAGQDQAPPATIRTCRGTASKVDEAEWQRGYAKGLELLLHPLSLPTARDGRGAEYLGSAPTTPASSPSPGARPQGVPAGAAPRRIAAGAGAHRGSIHQLDQQIRGESDSRQRDYYRAQRERAIRHYGKEHTGTTNRLRFPDRVIQFSFGELGQKGPTWPLLFMPQTVFPLRPAGPALQRQGDAIPL